MDNKSQTYREMSAAVASALRALGDLALALERWEEARGDGCPTCAGVATAGEATGALAGDAPWQVAGGGEG